MNDLSHTLEPISLTRLSATGLGLLVLMIIVGLLCSFSGPISVVETTGWAFWQSIIWQDRISRISAACLAGGGLSVAGLALQALLRNPLANPYILGVSSGAGVGVIAGLAMASRSLLPSFVSTPALAFIGAIVTSAVVYSVASKRGYLDPYSLILSGVMINAVNAALILVIYLFIDPYTLTSFVGWSMGQVPDSVDRSLLVICGISIVSACFWMFLRGAAFNTLGLGEVVALSSGVPVRRLRGETFIATGMITACAVALVGPVAFLGLFVPHVCRMILGPDHRRLTVVCLFVGAIFLVVCDTLCRYIGIAADLGKVPVGIVTALLGGPFFIWLLRNRDKIPIS